MVFQALQASHHLYASPSLSLPPAQPCHFQNHAKAEDTQLLSAPPVNGGVGGGGKGSTGGSEKVTGHWTGGQEMPVLVSVLLCDPEEVILGL